MPANNLPIFTLAPKLGAVAITAANTSSQGGGTIGTDIFLAITAGANGSRIHRAYFVPTASAAATSTTATVGRVFYSSQTSGTTTSSNTNFLREVALPSVSADHSTTPAVQIEVLANFGLAANQTLLVTNHAAPAANTQWKLIVEYGDY